MDIKIGDKFILHDSSGLDYKFEIININDFREPSMRYAIQAYDPYGNEYDDIHFIGDDFFETYNWSRSK